MAARNQWTTRTKTLWLACWNANVFHGWKLELDYIIGQHGIDICVMNDNFMYKNFSFSTI
jgi:hypothetical protein